MSEIQYQLRIQVDGKVDARFLNAQIAQNNIIIEEVDDSEFEAIDPVTAFVVVGGALALTQLIISAVDTWRGGTVIDLTGEQPTVRRDSGVLLGTTVIFTADGTVEIKSEDMPKTALERLVSQIISSGKELTAASIKELIKGVSE